MADTLLVDTAVVRQIGHGIFKAADRLAGAGRGLRFPLPAPAADPLSLRIGAGLSRCARAAGIAAGDAADELTRVGEALCGNLELVSQIARFTRLAQVGLVAPCPEGPAEFSATIKRDVQGDELLPVYQLKTWSDDEVLSCAVLLAGGDVETAGAFTAAPIVITEVGADIGRLAEALEEAWPATTASALLKRFAAWVSGPLEGVAGQIVAAQGQWTEEYRTAREAVSIAAGQYVSIRLQALDGADSELSADIGQVRSALQVYAQARIVESVTFSESYPRMKASGGRAGIG
ncbi:hypothetical protein ACNQR7_32755 [Mycolicibacterium senegalense]|uniref:hypothetical protein n=1 Tax=Mycolicibacterium senegalense TaxID=1796 RepID=UPI003AAB27B5